MYSLSQAVLTPGHKTRAKVRREGRTLSNCLPFVGKGHRVSLSQPDGPVGLYPRVDFVFPRSRIISLVFGGMDHAAGQRGYKEGQRAA